MRDIKKVIEEINKVETDFDIINSRIVEFWKSTDNTVLDFNLVNKYITSIEWYIIKLESYKEDVLNNKNNSEEYAATKKMVTFRIEKQKKIFSNTLWKLKIISEISSKDYSNNQLVDVDFDSRNEMLEIDKNIYEFYNEYNLNLEFQKKYEVELSLDDDFESKAESELSTSELIKKELSYMEWLNYVFEELEDINLDLYNIFNDSKEINEAFFSNFNNKYFPLNKSSYVFENFTNRMDSSYVNTSFELIEGKYYNDFKWFKRIVSKEVNSLKLLVSINKFILDFHKYEELSNKYNYLNNFSYFIKLFEVWTDLFDKDFKSASEASDYLSNQFDGKWITTTRKIVTLFNRILALLELYELLNTKYYSDLNFSILSFIMWFVWSSSKTVQEKYLVSWFENNKKESLNKLWLIKLDYSKESFDELFSLLKKEIRSFTEIQNSIASIKNYVNKKIVYNSSYQKLSKYTTNIKSKLSVLRRQLWHKEDLQLVADFENDILKEVKQRYRSSKSSYNSRSSSSSGWSSWSSWGSSFSSSYSSSGSSSW